MSDFPLINDMNNPEKPKKQHLPEGVPYKQFTIKVDKVETVIHIPLRESEAFKEKISEHGKITARILRGLLREFRGIKQREE